MLVRSHTVLSPWYIVRADDKKTARLNLIRDLLSRINYQDKNFDVTKPDRKVVFEFTREALSNGQLEH